MKTRSRGPTSPGDPTTRRPRFAADRVALASLKAVFFLVPLTMTNLTGLGLGQYTDDAFDTPKVFVLYTLVIVATGAWLWSWLRGEVVLRRTRYDLVVVAFVAWTAVATLFSVNPATSLVGRYTRYEGLATYVCLASVYFLTVQLITDDVRLRSVAKMIGAAGFLVACFGLLQVGGFDPTTWARVPFAAHMAYSTIGNPDTLGAYLIFPLTISLGLALTEPKPRSRLLHWGAVAVIGPALIASFSRGAWLGSLGALVVLTIAFVRQRHRLQRIDVYCLGASVAAAGVVIALSNRSTDAVTRFGARFASILAFNEGSGRTRLEIWSSALAAIRDRPWLGWGPDTFRQTFGHFKSVQYVLDAGYQFTADNAHNYVLQLATTIGVPGMLLAYGLFGAIGWRGLRRSLAAQTGTAASLLQATFLAAMFGYLVSLIFGLSVVSSSSLLWLALAAVAVTSTTPSGATPSGSTAPATAKPGGSTGRVTPERRRNTGAALVVGAACVLLTLNGLFVQADYFFHRGNEPSSETYLLRATERNPLNLAYKIGLAQYGSRTFDAWYNEVRKHGTNVLNDPAVRQQGEGYFQTAAARWNNVVRFSPRDSDGYTGLAMLENSYARLQSDYWAQAESAARSGLAYAPNTPMLRLQLAMALYGQDDIQQATAEATAAHAMDPAFLGPAYFLADVAMLRQDYAAALQTYESILHQQPNDERASKGAAEARKRLGSTP
ncbi:MAG: O-antigen ligase family protein [Actinobacteria bacterium]|nr:O-antigen ligase family protein [Actinomycetota bacterium]